MKQAISFLLSLSLVLPAGAAPAKKNVVLDKSTEVYVAVAAVHVLNRVETVGGFLNYIAPFMPKKDVTDLKRWLSSHGIKEDEQFPTYQVSGNKISYGRDSLTIESDHVVINKKKYPIKDQPISAFVDQVCKDLKCGNSKTSSLDPLFFSEAQAFGWFALGLAFVAGVVLARPARKIWRGFRNLFRGFRPRREVAGGQFIRTEIAARDVEEGYHCRYGNVVLERRGGGTVQAFDQTGERIQIPPNLLEEGLSCEQNAQMLNESVEVNRRRGNTEPLDGFRSVTSEPKKTAPAKVKSK